MDDFALRPSAVAQRAIAKQGSLAEVTQYGRDSFDDPNYVSLYGLEPGEWYARGARILGRTAVECTRDRLAELISRDFAAAARVSSCSSAVIVDPFAGSANTLFWIHQQIAGSRAMGFEVDEEVSEATRRNLSTLDLDLEVRQADYRGGLGGLTLGRDQLLIVFVAPPWADALHEVSGLDLAKTEPPVVEILHLLETRFPNQPQLVGIQIYETTEARSLADVTMRLDWSESKTYAINAPGQNHGLVLGGRHWSTASL